MDCTPSCSSTCSRNFGAYNCVDKKRRSSCAGDKNRQNFTSRKMSSFCWRRKTLPGLIAPMFLVLLSVHSVVCDIREPSENSPETLDDSRKILLPETGSGQQSDSNNSGNFACNEVRYYYNALSQAKGFTAVSNNVIPKKAVSGDHLKICARGFTCCTVDMESQLSEESRKDYQRVVQDKIIGLSHTFESRTSKFDRFFRELLINSRTDLHSMFLQTYGQFYSQHSEIFIKLFDNLTEYYTRGKLDLGKSLDGFYQSLYRRMFKIMNPHYQFSEHYWKCMEPMLDQLRPFGDVPQKMKQQVVRSFVAARTFVQALATGRDSIRKVMELAPAGQCASGLMRMMYCPHCRGLPGLKPCKNFCLDVMNRCLSEHAQLDKDWKEYVDMLLQLLERIEGPFNVESVIDGIDVKISEAIMIFQENGVSVSQQVFAGCGTPDGPVRDRRSAASKGRQEFTMADLSFGAQLNSNKPRPPTAAGTNLERLSRDIREKVQPVTDFWKKLPENLCKDNQIAAPDKRDTDCWNGVTRERYQPTVGVKNVENQGETNSDQPNPSMGEVMMSLKMATNRMRKAYNGRSVSWDHTEPAKSAPAIEEIEEEFSGSGDFDADLETTKATKTPVTIDTDDEDLVKQTPQWNLHDREWERSSTEVWERRTTEAPSTEAPLPVVPETDDEDMGGSGSGDFEDIQVDWRGTHREKEWETHRRPEVIRPEDKNPKFVQPPIRFETDSHRPEKKPEAPIYDSDFEVGIRAEEPKKGGCSRVRGMAIAWYLLLGLVLSCVVRWG